MRKTDRQRALLEIVAAAPVTKQEELAGLLRRQGFSVTQASVSRDLEELDIVKINGRYVRQPAVRYGRFGLVSYSEAGENLIVIRCGSGLASAAAVRIDTAAIPDVVGTIAGDDTIFVAVGGVREQRRVIKTLRELLGTDQGNDNN